MGAPQNWVEDPRATVHLELNLAVTQESREGQLASIDSCRAMVG